MVAMLGVGVGKADRRRIWTFVGGSVAVGVENRGNGRRRRHVVTICQIEPFALLVDAAECRRSQASDKS